MSISEALKIISDRDNFNPDDLEFQVALDIITEALGMAYDKRTEQFVTSDTGDII
tara:strand:+ start:191 stop:355 length:165 start_codon:yes stop_codon:yes gene_type:complete